MANICDRDLTNEFNAGGEQAMRHIFEAYYPRLLSFANSILKDGDDAKDAVMESFVRFHERITYVKDGSLASLLFMMIRNECYNRLRHRMIESKFKCELPHTEKGENLYYADFCPDAHYDYIYNDLQNELDKAVEELNERPREAFLLYQKGLLSKKEVAERMGIKAKSVDRYLAIAVAEIRKRLKDYGSLVALWWLLS